MNPFALIVAVMVRIILAGSTFHADLNAFILANNFINQDSAVSFYDSVRLLPADDPIKLHYSDKIFNYQPLSYLTPSLFYLPVRGLLETTSKKIVLSSDNVLKTGHPFEPSLVLYKLPFIFFDLLTAFFITYLSKNLTTKRKLQYLWLFNPVAIFVSSVMGQSDTMVTFFFLLSLVAIQDKRYATSAVFLGISALYKPAGLFLIPILVAAILPISFWAATKLLISGFGTYILGISIYLSSVSFRTYALLAEQTTKSTFAGISIASGTNIPWFFIAYTAIAVLLMKRRLKLIDGLPLALSSSLVFSHFHPQWFLWITPWLIYKTVSENRTFLFWTSITAWFVILLSFDLSLHVASFWWLGLVPNRYLFTSNVIFSNLMLLARAFLVSLPFLSVKLIKEKK